MIGIPPIAEIGWEGKMSRGKERDFIFMDLGRTYRTAELQGLVGFGTSGTLSKSRIAVTKISVNNAASWLSGRALEGETGCD